MKPSLLLISLALGFVISPTIVKAQTWPGEITGGAIQCDPERTSDDDDKILVWSGDWEDPQAIYPWSTPRKAVGCYAPVYGGYSPATYYSPGAAYGDPPFPSEEGEDDDPGYSGGSESVMLPKYDQYENELVGAYVWFEFGYWDDQSGYWLWHFDEAICDWYWVPNPGGSCFSAGTHLLTPEGSKPIEQFVVGDRILSSPRENRAAPPAPRRIERVIKRRAKLLEVVVDGQTVSTTAEHPFFTNESGWIPAASLAVGDLLRSHTDRWVGIESISDGAESTVYNVVVDGKSAYFVGHADWKFSIWASDACSNIDPPTQLLERPDGPYRLVTE